MNDFNYAELDPGIQQTVKWLHQNGFRTTDSGDGKTKTATMECALDTPNVAMVTSKVYLVSEADRLHRLLEEHKIPIDFSGMSQVNIQASYDPSDNTSVILLTGLDDDLLRQHL